MAEITKDYLQNRLKEAEQARDQALADANAWNGAIIMLRQILDYADKEKAPNEIPEHIKEHGRDIR